MLRRQDVGSFACFLQNGKSTPARRQPDYSALTTLVVLSDKEELRRENEYAEVLVRTNKNRDTSNGTSGRAASS